MAEYLSANETAWTMNTKHSSNCNVNNIFDTNQEFFPLNISQVMIQGCYLTLMNIVSFTKGEILACIYGPDLDRKVTE